jgi:hypothetical protein
MGNDASTAMQVVNAKKKMSSALDGLSTVPTKEAPRNHKEMKQREKERKEDFERKKQQREHRKSQLAQKWTTHRKSNADCEAPGMFGQILNETKQAVTHVTPKKKEGGGSWWAQEKTQEEESPTKPSAHRESAAERLSKMTPVKPEKKSTKTATPTKPAPAPAPQASGGKSDGSSTPAAATAPAKAPARAKATERGRTGGSGNWWEQAEV